MSNHAYGSAFDINVAWNPLGKPPAALGALVAALRAEGTRAAAVIGEVTAEAGVLRVVRGAER